MRSFLFVLCVALLLNGVAVARNGAAIAPKGGKVATWLASNVGNSAAVNAVKKAAVTTGALLAIGVTACGLQGCGERTQSMVKDVVQEKTTSKDNPVFIGGIWESEFKQSYWGLKLAIDQANREGGINGRHVELLDKTIYGRDKAFTVRVTENLVNYDNVLAIIGANYSTISEFIDEVAVQHGVPMVTMGSTSFTLTRAGPRVFLAAFPDSFQGLVIAKFVKDELQASNAAVLYWKEDAYSQGLNEAFRDSFRALGGKIVLDHGYSYNTKLEEEEFIASLDASGIAAEVRASQAEAVFIPSFAEAGIVAKVLRAADVNAVLVGADGWGAGDLIANGGDAVEGAYYTDHFTPDAAPEFTEAYTNEYGVAPDGLAALGYDAGRIVIEAARRTPDDLTHATLAEEIEKTSNYMGATKIIGYDVKRHPIKDVVLFQINNGEAVFKKTISP